MADVIYVATTNAGKLRDFSAAQHSAFAIRPLPGLHHLPQPDETGETFEANARLKAEYYSRLSPGLWVLADDSGLEVDALRGAPGVRSARFAADEGFTGEPGMTTDERNNACLLARLASAVHSCAAPQQPLTARYRCVLALARDGHVDRVASGEVEGMLLPEPRGSAGFGYDPLFYLPDLAMTMAEIDPATKQRISHRGQALRRRLLTLSPAGMKE